MIKWNFFRLQDRYAAQKKKEHYSSEEEISELVELAVFMAEMFYRVRVGNEVGGAFCVT